jgi:multimeric flavodoxin WrbA
MSAKQILILKSSPRKRANSSILADQVAAGAREAGAAVESVDLHNLSISPCDAYSWCARSVRR